MRHKYFLKVALGISFSIVVLGAMIGGCTLVTPQGNQQTRGVKQTATSGAIPTATKVVPLTEQQFVTFVNQWNSMKGPGSSPTPLLAPNGHLQRLGTLSDGYAGENTDPTCVGIELAWIELPVADHPTYVQIIGAYGMESGAGVFGEPKDSQENGVLFVSIFFDQQGNTAGEFDNGHGNHLFVVTSPEVGSSQLENDLLAPSGLKYQVDKNQYEAALQAAQGIEVDVFITPHNATDPARVAASQDTFMVLLNAINQRFSDLTLPTDAGIYIGTTFTVADLETLASKSLPLNIGFGRSVPNQAYG